MRQRRLKLRALASDSGELIFYRRANLPGPKESFYVRSPTSAPDALRDALSMAYGEIGRVRSTVPCFSSAGPGFIWTESMAWVTFSNSKLYSPTTSPSKRACERHTASWRSLAYNRRSDRRRLCRPSVQALAVARRWLRTLDRKAMSDALVNLQEAERSCAERYLSLLRNTLADNLRAVWLFGSFCARGYVAAHMPMNSDIDLLVITESEVSSQTQEALLNETYPLYLECGRQISPQFWTVRKFGQPSTEKRRRSGSTFLAMGKYCCHGAEPSKSSCRWFRAIGQRFRVRSFSSFMTRSQNLAPSFCSSHRPRTSLPPSARTPRAIWIALLRTMPSSRILTRIASKKTSG